MNHWSPEALALVRSVKTNCNDFIGGASEYVAKLRDHETVQIEDVQTVLSWLESTKEKA